ncbi:MAG: hypothetical protein M3069_02010, partial [Chloroflexota bacterium]|nr:hypothetical protein [Chloroflexota bacterium]
MAAVRRGALAVGVPFLAAALPFFDPAVPFFDAAVPFLVALADLARMTRVVVLAGLLARAVLVARGFGRRVVAASSAASAPSVPPARVRA